MASFWASNEKSDYFWLGYIDMRAPAPRPEFSPFSKNVLSWRESDVVVEQM
jgi:hypothetical protein